jgi:hypothetical protein
MSLSLEALEEKEAALTRSAASGTQPAFLPDLICVRTFIVSSFGKDTTPRPFAAPLGFRGLTAKEPRPLECEGRRCVFFRRGL